jgi:hypothetical protein
MVVRGTCYCKQLQAEELPHDKHCMVITDDFDDGSHTSRLQSSGVCGSPTWPYVQNVSHLLRTSVYVNVIQSITGTGLLKMWLVLERPRTAESHRLWWESSYHNQFWFGSLFINCIRSPSVLNSTSFKFWKVKKSPCFPMRLSNVFNLSKRQYNNVVCC